MEVRLPAVPVAADRTRAVPANASNFLATDALLSEAELRANALLVALVLRAASAILLF
tara:strand:- start:19943 stop:20116 length:174 start_codon:yes stop_codon:yes gene_type:complete